MTTYAELADRKIHAPNSRLVNVESFELSGVSIYKLILTNQEGLRNPNVSATKQYLVAVATLSKMEFVSPKPFIAMESTAKGLNDCEAPR